MISYRVRRIGRILAHPIAWWRMRSDINRIAADWHAGRFRSQKPEDEETRALRIMGLVNAELGPDQRAALIYTLEGSGDRIHTVGTFSAEVLPHVLVCAAQRVRDGGVGGWSPAPPSEPGWYVVAHAINEHVQSVAICVILDLDGRLTYTYPGFTHRWIVGAQQQLLWFRTPLILPQPIRRAN